MKCFGVLKSKKKSSEQINPNLSAQISFKNKSSSSSRIRALSAPSTLNIIKQDDLDPSIEYDEEQESQINERTRRTTITPQPLPLPAPPQNGGSSAASGSVLTPMGSFKVVNVSGPLPLPPTTTVSPIMPPYTGNLRNYSFEELAAACNNFSPEQYMSGGISSVNYRASFGDKSSSFKKLEATVTRLNPSSQGLKEFLNEVNTLGSLQHPFLCKVIGFHAREGSDHRMLVYERLFHGSLDRLLYGRKEGPSLDWNARMKIALCAAQGLTFLHEEGPFQAMYQEFSTVNIQVHKDFTAKLTGYGCISYITDTEFLSSSSAIGTLSIETMEKGLLTPKSNVWSYGIMLLELLTGRKNLDSRHPKEERNLVKWSRPFLTDDCRLSLIMDPQLQGRFPTQASRTVADIAQRCLQMEPSERPTMRSIVDRLKTIQDMKHPSRFPLQEPGKVAKFMAKSSSFNAIITPSPQLGFSPPPGVHRGRISQTRMGTPPISLPHHTFTSPLSLDEIDRQVNRLPSSSNLRKTSVEGL